MSTSDSSSDPFYEEWIAFQSKLEKFQKLYTDEDDLLNHIALNETQNQQLKAMYSDMVQYEEARGTALNKRQEFIFHKVYIDEPMRAYSKLFLRKKKALGYRRERVCDMKPISLESDNDIDVLCFALKHCSSGKDISLDGIMSDSLSPLNTSRIVSAVANSNYLNKLFWRAAEIGDETTGIIAKALSSSQNLSTLNLNDNHIGDDGAKELASMLRASKTIEKINLEDNRIGDSGAQHLADALIQNNNATELHIWNNNFGESGLRCIVDALLHNHRCDLYLDIDDMEYMKEQYLDEDKTFNEFHYAIRYLSELNTSEESVEDKSFKKAMLIQKSSQPEGDFEAWWFPVFHDIDENIIQQLWETSLGKVDKVGLQKMIRKRNEIDLRGDEDIKVDPDGSGVALQNQIKQRDEYGATLKKVKIEKEATEDALAEAKDDIEDANELVQQQSLFTDKWQGKFDDLAKLAEKAGVDLQEINKIRYR